LKNLKIIQYAFKKSRIGGNYSRFIQFNYDDQTQSGAVVIPDEIVTISVTGNIEKEELIRIAEDMK
jgi:hypothetical protein